MPGGKARWGHRKIFSYRATPGQIRAAASTASRSATRRLNQKATSIRSSSPLCSSFWKESEVELRWGWPRYPHGILLNEVFLTCSTLEVYRLLPSVLLCLNPIGLELFSLVIQINVLPDSYSLSQTYLFPLQFILKEKWSWAEMMITKIPTWNITQWGFFNMLHSWGLQTSSISVTVLESHWSWTF